MPGPRITGCPGRTGPRYIGCPGAGEVRVGAAGLGRVCCKRFTKSGRGGTVGRADGCPANPGRDPCGRGAIGAPGVRPDGGRGGAGRDGMGAPGIDDGTGVDAAGPGAIRCVGTCADFGGGGMDAVDGADEASGADPGRSIRSGVPSGRWRVSAGKGCRGPVGRTPLGEDPGIGRGAGRAGTEIGRLTGPAPTG